MNLRLGAFGRQESTAAVILATFTEGCFAFDNRTQFSQGNASYLTYAAASILSLLLFEMTVAAIRRRRGNDLYSLIGPSKSKALLAVPLLLALLLAAMQPMEHFLLTVTQYVFVEAKQTSVCLYALPCLLLLTALGAETIVRTSRIFLPMLTISLLSALLLALPQYRTYRLFPLPTGAPFSLLAETVRTVFRTFLPLLALLCIWEGTQTVDAMRFSGRLGAPVGGSMTVLALLGLGLSFPYAQLKEMPAPFYRLLVEVRTENPTMRLDRATLFLWMTVALLSSAFYLYAACVLFAKTFAVRDIRPLAFLMSALAVTLILILYYDSETTHAVLRALYRYAWMPAVLPVPLLWIHRERRSLSCACGSHSLCLCCCYAAACR